MRRSSVLVFVLVLLACLGVVAVLSAQDKAAKTETLTGTLVDLKCYAAGGFLTNDHGSMKGCGTACAKGGNPVALVDANKKVHFLAVAAPEYADWVGAELRLTGKHASNAGVFLPEKVEAKENGKWVEKKAAKGMM
ncbi:MAG: hypothetical protein ACREOO_22505 [bacterium]